MDAKRVRRQRSWVDVSMPLSPRTPAFPGDPSFATHRVKSIAAGAAYNLSELTFGSHAGTHVDPPVHFVEGGATMDSIDLGSLNGPCWVLEVAPSVTEIGPEELGAVPRGTTRLLLRTSNSARWQRRLEFFPDYTALTEAGAREIVARGLLLVGLDALSIERDLTGRFPVHHALLSAGTLILEGLLLADAPTGAAEIACLPLRVEGGDGGPARVRLRPR